MLNARHDLNLGSGVALQFVGDQNSRCVAHAIEKLAKEPFGYLPIAPALHQDVE